MAKTFVRISLATKFRVLFASAVVVIILAALAAPWYVTERLLDDAASDTARQITDLGAREWADTHWRHLEEKGRRPPSAIARHFTDGHPGRRGPNFSPLPDPDEADETDPAVGRAVRTFIREPARQMALTSDERDEEGRRIYRCLRAVRATADCRLCHDGDRARAFQPNQLVGLIDVSFPPDPPGRRSCWSLPRRTCCTARRLRANTVAGWPKRN